MGISVQVKAVPTMPHSVDTSNFYLSNYPIKEIESLRDEDSYIANGLPDQKSYTVHDDNAVKLDAVEGRMLDLKFDIDYFNR